MIASIKEERSKSPEIKEFQKGWHSASAQFFRTQPGTSSGPSEYTCYTLRNSITRHFYQNMGKTLRSLIGYCKCISEM